MSHKIFKRGLYVYVIDLDTDVVIEGGGGTFEFRKTKSLDSSFFVYRNNQIVIKKAINISDIQKENGDPYSLSEFEEFKEFNTGFDWPRNQGAIKLLFNTQGQNIFEIQLVAGVETQVIFPQPLKFSTVTNWPLNVLFEKQTADTFFKYDNTYGMRVKENEINRQEHDYRFLFDYTRQGNSVDEQIEVILRNPISSFEDEFNSSMLRGSLSGKMSAKMNTTSDEFSLESQNIGAGYQIFMKSTIDVLITPKSWKSIINYKDRLIPF